MNRPGGVPQSLRGLQTNFGGQQQSQQGGRAGMAGRLPNGKMGSNGAGWAFGGGMPMAGNTLPNTGRQLGGNISFAQSLSGSQPQTPLDLSDFPSLSSNAHMTNANSSSMWSSSSRNIGGPVQRNQGTPLPSQASQQDDLFSPSSRLPSAQGSFRFGNQGNPPGLSSQNQSAATDEFPPLSRNANGEIGQERNAGLISSLGFAAQSTGAASTRAGNGLLNALSANARAGDTDSPTADSSARLQDTRALVGEEEARQKLTPYLEESMAGPSDNIVPQVDTRKALGAIGKDAPSGKGKEEESHRNDDIQDPLQGMAAIDKFGLKGLHTLMNNFPDYRALTVGIDPVSLGLDLNSPEPIATQHYSLFDDTPPRPAIPNYRLPECYHVDNVQPMENKINSFNEETLMWIFYSCPGDAKQQMAATELTNRNWRWHKKHQVWLTKDDLMHPQVLSTQHERGYYIIWDTQNWRKERRELTLHYNDLDNPASQVPVIST